MGNFFSRIGAFFQTLFSWLLPVQQLKQGAEGRGRAFRWVVHVLLVVAVLVGLFFLNRALRLDRDIPRSSPVLRHGWLPILFLLLYFLVWMLVWLGRLLRADPGGSAHPDIDHAWEEAKVALEQAGVRLDDLPLFLVLGRPEGDERQLFQASQASLVVGQAPPRGAPLHAYATRDAIFVTCAGASLLGRHAEVLAGPAEETPAPAAAPAPSAPAPESTHNPRETLTPEEAAGAVAAIAEVRAGADREGRELNDPDRRRIRRLYRRDSARTSVLARPEEADRLTDRLAHLCRLIARDRRPLCPLNGVLVLVPFAGTDHPQDATTTGAACYRDLATVRRAAPVRCPVFVLVCDFETVPGFEEFIECFSARERLQRVGQRCPLVPDFRGGAASKQKSAGAMLDSLSAWVCNSVVPAWVYRKFVLEDVPAPHEAARAQRLNTRLFRLAHELREREPNLRAILSHALGTDPGDPPLIGGCYLAGTGRDPRREQAFVSGVLHRLVEEQNAVAWGPEAVEEDARYQRWAAVGWAVLGAAILGAVAWLIYALFFAPGRGA